MLGSQTLAAVASLMLVLKIRIQILMLAWQAFYPLSHVPAQAAGFCSPTGHEHCLLHTFKATGQPKQINSSKYFDAAGCTTHITGRETLLRLLNDRQSRKDTLLNSLDPKQRGPCLPRRAAWKSLSLMPHAGTVLAFE